MGYKNVIDSPQIAIVHMKKSSFLLPILFFALYLNGQEPYQFTEIKMQVATPVKSQDRTGTCWAFSTASFLESEAKRLGKGEHDLSEMYVVRHVYRDKCEHYVRRQGTANLTEGGLAHDLLRAVARYGLVPESVYPGKKDPSRPHDHTAIASKLKTRCNELVSLGKKGALPPNWLMQIDTILDAEFGKLPARFKYAGTEYTPPGFRDYLNIKPADYVNLTSFTHHPFFADFVLEVPDNFYNESFYNIPLDDLMRTLQNAIQMGYTVEWDGDVSNEGFSTEKGIAIVPQKAWADKAARDQQNTFILTENEQAVSQAYRQELFDRQITQDDHLMHITGMLDEANSGLFYAVKNSWGDKNERKGYIYASEAYLRLNTISITVHKDALSQDLRKQMGAGTTPNTPVKLSVPNQPTPLAPEGKFKKVEAENTIVLPPKTRATQDTSDH